MKVIKRIFSMMTIAAMVILFIGCSKDDDKPANPLIGSWKLISEVVSECTDPDDNYTDSCTTDCEIFIFTATTVSIDGDSYPYTVSGNTIIIDFGSGISLSINYVVAGTTLTLTIKDSPQDGSCKNVYTFSKV